MKPSGIIIHYSMKELGRNDKPEFCRKFWGYTEKSNYARYSYLRKGIMSDIPHVRVGRSIVIIKEQNLSEVLDFMKTFLIEPFYRRIILEKEDLEVLGE